MRLWYRLTYVLLSLLSLSLGKAIAEPAVLIPRAVIFGNPAQTAAQLSPDGKWYSYLAPSRHGVLNIWLQDIAKTQPAIMLTQEQQRRIRDYAWSKDGKHILYFQDKNGDENWHLYRVRLADQECLDLTPFSGVRAERLRLDNNVPNQVLIGLNRRDPHWFDIYRINLTTNTIKLDTANPGRVENWLADSQLQIRAVISTDADDGSANLLVRNNINVPWRVLMHWPFGEQGSLLGFSLDGQSLYITSSLQRDTARILQLDSNTGRILKVLAYHPKSDLEDVFISHHNRKIQVVRYEYLKPKWQVLDKQLAKDFAYLSKAQAGFFDIASRDLNEQNWLVKYQSDINPGSYYLYQRATETLKLLFITRPELVKYRLANMQPITIQARDGMTLTGYLTLPVELVPQHLPLVLLVHGGPWVRDSWGYRAQVQWLANRGYAVLQLNYRGSTGFGKHFLNAGNGQWGKGAMQHDLTDAVHWAIKQGLADPNRVAIYGGSYGGYATLAGLAFTPELYACGIDVVGPADLKTLLTAIPSYWQAGKKKMLLRIGDVEEDDAFNQQISPLYHVDKIRAPLLIAQGAHDPRVNIAQADAMVAALRQRKLPIDYIIYSDEGHGFARPENRLDFYGRAEEFLAKYMKGRVEPWYAVANSSAIVK